VVKSKNYYLLRVNLNASAKVVIMEDKPPETPNAEEPVFEPTDSINTVDVHLVNYGIIFDQDIIFSSSPAFESMLQVVNYANSFAMNIQDGRLCKIKHELDGKMHTTLIQTRIVNDQSLMYVISGSDDQLLPNFQQQIINNYTKEIENTISIKRIEKLYEDKLDEFTIKMHRIADKIDQGISLIHDMEESDDAFLVKEKEYALTRIHYIGLSTGGVPVRNMLYGKELVSLFKVPSHENVPPEEIVRSLISAQFSAIINSSLIKANTRISEITILFTHIESMEPTQLKIAFFPLGYQSQYTLEICYQGKRDDIEGFKIGCMPMFERYVHIPFKGNLHEFELVSDLLNKLPRNFDLFDQMAENFEDGEDNNQDHEAPDAEENNKPKKDESGIGDLKLNF